MRFRLFAVLALVAIGGMVPTSAWAADSAKDLIVGRWQPTDKDGERAVIEFAKDGKVKVIADKLTLEGTYKFVKDDQIEVTMLIKGKDSTVKLAVKVTKDQLTTTEVGKDGMPETFRRAK